MIDQATGAIVCTAHAKGRVHDFRIFKQSRLPLNRKIQLLADQGYQGVLKLHANSQTHEKKPKKVTLNKAEHRSNRTLAQRRVIAEHVNCRLKIWRILSERYRNRFRRLRYRFNLIAGMHNYKLALKNKSTPEGAS